MFHMRFVCKPLQEARSKYGAVSPGDLWDVVLKRSKTSDELCHRSSMRQLPTHL
jgi:hypothetical protein